MYSLRYSFGPYNSAILKYIESIIRNSTANFQAQVKHGEITDKEHDSKSLAKCIENMEDYFYYTYKKTPKDFVHIANSIIKNVKAISVLPNAKRGVYGYTDPKSKTIFINPDLKPSKYLTAEERTRLYMAHELGHCINADWTNATINYVNQQITLGRLTRETAQQIYDGFSMLDEAITQNRAENFAYEFSKKRRPPMTARQSRFLFNSESYRSNFDYYGELQEPAIMFARTLRGIGKEKDDRKVLDLLSQRALKADFFEKILMEYVRDGQMTAFVEQLKNMGYLKRASYAVFGMDEVSYLRNSKTYLDDLRKVSTQMRDFRDPFHDEDGNR